MPTAAPPLGDGWWPTGRTLTQRSAITVGVAVVAGVGLGLADGTPAESALLGLSFAALTWVIATNIGALRRALNSTHPVLDRQRDRRQLRGKEPYTAVEIPRLRIAADRWGRQSADAVVGAPGMIVYVFASVVYNGRTLLIILFLAACAALVVAIPFVLRDVRTARRFLAATSDPTTL